MQEGYLGHAIKLVIDPKPLLSFAMTSEQAGSRPVLFSPVFSAGCPAVAG
jgi:hypothetical protein